MVFDCCMYMGHWPFRKLKYETLADVCAQAQKADITHMLCANLNAIFYIDPMEGNRELIEACRAYEGEVKVYPLAVINPMYIEWQRDLQECAALGFAGIQLAPQYHGYKLTDPCARQLYKLAGDLGLIVKLDVGFENIRQRHRMDTLEELQGADIAALLGSDARPVTIISMAPPAYMGAAFQQAVCSRENVLISLTYMDSFINGQVEQYVENYGIGRICFGTQFPFRYIEPQYAKLFNPGIFTEDELEAILHRNLAQLVVK